MDTTIIIFIIGAVALILLAFLGSMINLEFEWPEGKLPKVKLQFQKDQNLWGWMREGEKSSELRTKSIDKDLTNKDFLGLNLFGEVRVKYGENADTLSSKTYTILSQKDFLNSINYYNADSNTYIKLNTGFKNNTPNFIQLRKFPSWNGTAGVGVFSNLHRVSLEIPTLMKNEKHTMEINFKSKIHYREDLHGNELVSHGFYFRTDCYLQNGANLTFVLPIGRFSTLKKLDLYIEQNNHKEDEFIIENIENQNFTVNDKISGDLKIEKDDLIVHWIINKSLSEGTVCTLDWYTKMNKKR